MTSFAELYEQAEQDDAYHLAGAILEFTEAISARMERHQVSRAELARRLDSSPSYVTKILRGNANFTLASMVKLARALGAELSIDLVPADASRRAILQPFPASRTVVAEYRGSSFQDSSEDAGDEQTALAA